MASVSRSHLYRASGPARPLASIVLAALWCGGAIAVLVAAWPFFMAGVPLNGPGAALVERGFTVLTTGGLLVGLGVIGAELFGGRTTARWLRLAGAVLLLLVSGAGMLQSFRHLLRPGTPTTAQATEVLPAAPAPAASATPAGSVQARERFILTLVGLVGASLTLGAGLLALRSDPRAP